MTKEEVVLGDRGAKVTGRETSSGGRAELNADRDNANLSLIATDDDKIRIDGTESKARVMKMHSTM